MIATADVEALISRALPRERVILNALPDHIERHDVMVIPKEDWIQLLIWLAVLTGHERVGHERD